MEEIGIKQKAIKGFAWSAIDKIAVQGITFVFGIMLARILLPSDYGLIGMLSVFIAVSQLFVNSGFTNALIQKKDRTETDFATIFYFNLATAVFFYLVLFFSAPFIASFYNIPELSLITRVVSLSIIINSLSLVPQTRLVINMNFKVLAIRSLFSVLISGSIGLYLAYTGYGVWALVVQNLSSVVVRTLLLLVFEKWVPLWVFSKESFKKLFSYSVKLLTAGLVGTIYNNLYSIILGKIFSAKEVGFYTKGKQYPELISNTLASVLQGVTFPVLSSLQDNRDKLVSVYGRVLGMTTFVVFPVLTLFALLAEPFVRFFLTEKWMPVVPLIQWMCFAKVITPISSVNMNILNAIGRSDLFLKVDMSKLPLTIGVLIATVPFGLMAVVIGHFCVSFICFFINTYYPGKLFGFGAIRQIKEMRFVLLSTSLMAIFVFAVTYLNIGDLLKLVLGIPLGLTVYLTSSWLFKTPEFKEVQLIVQPKLVKLGLARK